MLAGNESEKKLRHIILTTYRGNITFCHFICRSAISFNINDTLLQILFFCFDLYIHSVNVITDIYYKNQTSPHQQII